jgi:hypothetical protein
MRALIQKTQYENRGINAPKGSEIAYKGIDEIVANHRTDLKNNPEALEYFNLHIFPVQDNWKNENAKFTLQESDRVYTDSTSGRLTDARVRGIQAAGDPKNQQMIIAETSNIIAEFDARMGNAPEATTEKQKAAISSIVAGSVDWLSNVPGRSGYDATKTYYSNNKELLTPEQVKHFDESLKMRGYSLDASDAANAFIAENAKAHNGVSEENWKTQQSDIKSFIDKHSDNPEYQQVLEATLNKNMRRAIGIEAQAFANLVNSIKASVDKLGYLDDQTASMMTGDKWTPDMKQAIYRYAASSDRATDNDTYQTLFNNIVSAEDVHALSVYEADMAKNVGKLSNANQKFLMDEINDMRSLFANADKFYASKEGRMSKDFDRVKERYLNKFFMGVEEKTINEKTPFCKEKFREYYDSWTANGTKAITDAQMADIGRFITEDRVIEMTMPKWWGEGATEVHESDMFKWRMSGKALSGVAPGQAFIGFGGMDVTSDNFNKLSNVVLQAMDTGSQSDKMRAEMALDMLPIGKTYRQFKADYEMKYNNGRLLPDSQVAPHYIDQHIKTRKDLKEHEKNMPYINELLGPH